MSLTQVGYSDIGITADLTGTSATVSVPSGLTLLANDLVLVTATLYNPDDAAAVAPPDSSWKPVTAASHHQTSTDVTGDHTEDLLWLHYATASEAGPWVFTWTGTAGYHFECEVVRGAPLGSPIDVAVTTGTVDSGSLPSASESWVGPTLHQANELVIFRIQNDQGHSVSAVTGVTGFTPRGVGASCSVFDKVVTASGALGTLNTTATGAADATGMFIAILATALVPVNSVRPVITGTPQQGDLLSVDDGTFTNAPLTGHAYLWLRDGVSIGVTTNTYRLVGDDVGHTITASVVATNSSGDSIPAVSRPTPMIVAGVPVNDVAPTILGVAAVGMTLVAETGSWEAANSYTYQWQRDTGSGPANITLNSTGKTYLQVSADIGASLSCVVKATNTAGFATVSTAPVGPVQQFVSAVAPYVGGTLSVDDGSWTGSPSSFDVKWRRDPGSGPVNITGAASLTYQPVVDDVGCVLTVSVVAHNALPSLPAISDPTGVVGGGPVNIGVPTISGTAVVGQVLTADPGDWNGNPVLFEYQWFGAGTLITGEISNTYVPQESDVGDALTVTVTATNVAGFQTSASAGTAAVADTGGGTGPVLALSADTITWSAVSGATGYQGSISTDARGTSDRTTSYVLLGNVTSWSPPSVPGETVYYGVDAITTAGDQWSAVEQQITWPGASPTTSVITGINSLMNHNYIANLVAIFKNAGIKSDRVEITGTDLTEVKAAVSAGLTESIVLYNTGGGLAGVTAAQAASDVVNIAGQMATLGLTILEFGNEVYFKLTPQQYAALYHAAHAALVGKGITLICCGAVANNTGSNASPTWINQVIAALPGGPSEVDAWAIHPYGSMTTNTLGLYGWANLTQSRAIAVAAGSNAPFYVTEVGQSIGTTPVNTSLPVANATIQGADVAQYFSDSLADGYVRGVWIYSSVDDGTGQFGVTNLLNTSTAATTANERPAFTAMAAFAAAHPT